MAGDGIDDSWQFDFFDDDMNDMLDGTEAANAAPGANGDGDPDGNLREFLFGFDPTDPNDFFQLTVDGFSGVATLDLRMNKAIPGRTYRLMESGDLATTFTEVGNFTVPGEEVDKLVQDTGAPAGRNFYRMEAEKN